MLTLYELGWIALVSVVLFALIWLVEVPNKMPQREKASSPPDSGDVDVVRELENIRDCDWAEHYPPFPMRVEVIRISDQRYGVGLSVQQMVRFGIGVKMVMVQCENRTMRLPLWPTRSNESPSCRHEVVLSREAAEKLGCDVGKSLHIYPAESVPPSGVDFVA